MTEPTTDDRLRAALAELDDEHQARAIREWLDRHLVKFEALGARRDAVVVALLAEALRRVDPTVATVWLGRIAEAEARAMGPAGYA